MGGLQLFRRAGPAAAALVLASVYVEHVLQTSAAGPGPEISLSDPGRLGEALAWYVVAAAAAALFSAPAIRLLAGRLCRRPAEPAALATAAAGAWRLWLAGLLYALATSLGALFFLIPGLVLSVAWVLYGPATVLAGTGPVRALRLSYRRVRRNRGRVVALIAGPFLCYGAVFAVGAAPSLLAALHYALASVIRGGAFSPAGAAHAAAAYAAPAWFGWGVMPILYAAARLYLFAAVVTAWHELEEA